MLDKTRSYEVFSKRAEKNSSTRCPKHARVKILFEDAVSWYVQVAGQRDSRKFEYRYSLKKHCYRLVLLPVPVPPKIPKLPSEINHCASCRWNPQMLAYRHWIETQCVMSRLHHEIDIGLATILQQILVDELLDDRREYDIDDLKSSYDLSTIAATCLHRLIQLACEVDFS